MKKTPETLRWGYSTGACAAAVAKAAWLCLQHGRTPGSVWLLFPDGRERLLPLENAAGHMAAIRKNGGDDPDCTHGALIHGALRPCTLEDGRPEDYQLAVGEGIVIVRAVGGIGLCTRTGLDCEQGRWAINSGPRRMIADNLRLAGLVSGCWLLELGIEGGEELARHTLNARLGIVGGLSLLGTTGLVRPYSHESYVHTIRICVRAHRLAGGEDVVFCTGGRTRAGAMARLNGLPETAFGGIGDFIAESLSVACRSGMKKIVVACMPGKLCKYASGFGNTHAHKKDQNMALFLAEVQRLLPDDTALHAALADSPSIRNGLSLLPPATERTVLERLAGLALGRLVRYCPCRVRLRLMLFDFEGRFLLEAAQDISAGVPGHAATLSPDASFPACPEEVPDSPDEEAAAVLADAPDRVDAFYFMEGAGQDAGADRATPVQPPRATSRRSG